MIIAVYPELLTGRKFTNDLTSFHDKLSPYQVMLEQDVVEPEKVAYFITGKLYRNPKDIYPNLKGILSLTAGVNQYMNSPFLPKDVQLVRLLDQSIQDAMVEYMTGMAMRIHLRFDDYDQLQRDVTWGINHFELRKTPETKIGVLGAGDLGGACAVELARIGFDMSCWSRSPKNIDGVTSFFGMDQLDKFLSDRDILLCLLPHTPQTENILNAARLRALPKGASIVNAGRATAIVEDDLIAALDDGHIHYAYIDVFRQEPLPSDHPFWGHPKIRMTPHISAITRPETAVDHFKYAIEMIEAGQTPNGAVDFARGY